MDSTPATGQGPAPPTPAPPPAPAAAGPLTVKKCLATVALGLIPLFGLIACLIWAYGTGHTLGRRNLSKALLWLHGIALAAGIVALCVWVLTLASRQYAYGSPIL